MNGVLTGIRTTGAAASLVGLRWAGQPVFLSRLYEMVCS